jgi:hypothetical protein
VNGVEGSQAIDTQGDAAVDFHPISDLEVGSDLSMPNDWFLGVIDELEFYNAAITPASDPTAAIPRVTWTYEVKFKRSAYESHRSGRQWDLPVWWDGQGGGDQKNSWRQWIHRDAGVERAQFSGLQRT